MLPPVRVLIAEDDARLLGAVSDLIAGEPGLEVVAVADSVLTAVEQAGLVKPDVALLDVRMPGGGGPSAAREIRRVSPGTRSLAFSAYDDRSNVLAMLSAGAVGYVMKGDPPGELTEAIRRAARGLGSLSSAMVLELAAELTADGVARSDSRESIPWSESLYRTLVETCPDAVTVADADGEIMLANERAERLFGYQPGGLVGLAVSALLPPRVRDEHRKLRAAHVATSDRIPTGTRISSHALRRDGTEFPVEVSISSVETADGVRTMAFTRDSAVAGGVGFTRRNQLRADDVIETAPIGVVLVNADLSISFCNAHVEALFEHKRTELIGHSIETLIPDLGLSRDAAAVSAAEPDAGPFVAGPWLTGRRRNGTDFPVEIRLAPIRGGSGCDFAVFIDGPTEVETRAQHVRTARERRAVLERLLSAGEDERRRIASDIHDDSIQVMTAVGMRLEILRRLLDDPEQLLRMDELGAAIRLSVASLRHLIFDLRPPMLDDEGIVAALRSYIDAIDQVSGPVFTVLDRLTSEPSRSARLVLYRIAQEALSNVRKHAEATRCTVILTSTSRGSAIAIRDDGVGFVPELNFTRPGHLGLASIRERTELADGGLRIHSSPGVGTTLYAWITEMSGADVLPSEAA